MCFVTYIFITVIQNKSSKSDLLTVTTKTSLLLKNHRDISWELLRDSPVWWRHQKMIHDSSACLGRLLEDNSKMKFREMKSLVSSCSQLRWPHEDKPSWYMSNIYCKLFFLKSPLTQSINPGALVASCHNLGTIRSSTPTGYLSISKYCTWHTGVQRDRTEVDKWEIKDVCLMILWFWFFNFDCCLQKWQKFTGVICWSFPAQTKADFHCWLYLRWCCCF